MEADSRSLLSRFFSFLASRFQLDRDADVPKFNLRLLRQMWELSIPFWTRPGAWVNWLVLIVYTTYTLGFAVVAARLAKLVGDQLDALANHDSHAFYRIIVFALLTQVGSSIVMVLCGLPFDIMFERWRQWLSQQFIREYLAEMNYYKLNRDRRIDNPDERIAIDIAQFVRYPTQVFLGLLRCASNFCVFGYVLWSFSRYLVPLCLVYYVIYSVITLILSKPIMNLSYFQRKFDGDYRFSLVNVRVNAESVAFWGGEHLEKRELFRRLDILVDNSIRHQWWSSALSIWLQLTDNFSSILPGLLVAPFVLRGALTLTAFSQAQNAWIQLGSAFGFVGEQAMSFAYGGALIARLYSMRKEMVNGPQPAEFRDAIKVIESPCLVAENFTLSTPLGERVLVSDLSFDLKPRSGLLVTGATGVGKSSLLRGLAGLWTRGSGELHLPPRDRMVFLPQRPYMSLGTLREQITYPVSEETVPENAIREVLEQVQLGHLEERFGGFGSKLDWSHVLSPGEQQRLAFARVLLRRPDLVILDEATSAINVEGEQSLYELLQQMGNTYLSVAHRQSLYPFHDRVLELKGGGAWEMKSIEGIAVAK